MSRFAHEHPDAPETWDDPLGLATLPPRGGPVDRARELGAEHGARDAEAWRWSGPEPLGYMLSLLDAGQIDDLPEPDLSAGSLARNFRPWSERTREELDAYEDAYRAARDETIRARCEP